QVIRSSDDAASAKQRLMAIFELSDIQAQYILDTPLRRLTRYDRLELEREQDALRAEIASLTSILSSDAKLRAVVSEELADVAKRFGTPRRTVLLEGGESVAAADVPLEVADDPCVVLLSATGLVARVSSGDSAERALVPPPAEASRAAHDVVVSAVRGTVRGTVGLVTSAGRLVRLNVLELPAMPAGAGAVSLAGGTPVSEFASFLPGETVVGLCAADGVLSAGVALGTAEGVVKRVLPDYPQNRDEFELISLRADDRVVGAVQLSDESDELVFITSDAQLLRFVASSVRPQGRAAGGMAGVRLSAGASVVWFGAVSASSASGTPSGAPGTYSPAVVVTVAGSAGALPGARAGSVKVTPLHEFPGKGRATGGVRCHRFLKGEEVLVMAWAGPAPAAGASDAGRPVDLPDPVGKRDGSGVALRRQLTVIGGAGRVP
ncbi:MAG TPA: DNA gyrase C-terminal beta-propeller domain-containing protein, partial [Streptosporangiaceae bacterium]|nr:DNA gyrase C-terminal beta-propeller domain-containing protein [Streptosporangiaceae bacterium]